MLVVALGVIMAAVGFGGFMTMVGLMSADQKRSGAFLSNPKTRLRLVLPALGFFVLFVTSFPLLPNVG